MILNKGSEEKSKFELFLINNVKYIHEYVPLALRKNRGESRVKMLVVGKTIDGVVLKERKPLSLSMNFF